MDEWEEIPGSTPIDPSGLRKAGITNRRELAVAEADNIRKPTLKYLASRVNRKRAPFDFHWCLQLHSEMFGEVWEWAGQTRKIDLNLGVPWMHIDAQLYQLMQSLNEWPTIGVDLALQSVRLHYSAVKIHPFRDGNGRWSRLLANIWLKLHGQSIVEWPTEISNQESVIRQEYIAAIEGAVNSGIEKPLIELHRRFTPSEDPGS